MSETTSDLRSRAFGFTQSTGGAGLPPPMQLLSGAFSWPFGLLPGYRIPTSAGTCSANGTTNNDVNWSGAPEPFKADGTIFADGFEYGTTSNQSFTQS